jgi:hypothetical protein
MKILCAIDGSGHSQWALAGCGKSISARQNSDSLHFLDNRTRFRRVAERDWLDGRDGGGSIWFIWSIWFNQTNETDQINKRDRPVLALHAPWTA